jgi:tetratricopeptide (TPR) repeat protein
MNLKKKCCVRWLITCCGILFAWNTTTAAENPLSKLSIYSNLQINYDAEILRALVSEAEAAYYDWRNETAIFPENTLIGTFKIVNLTADTLKLELTGQPLLKDLTLTYSYRGDSTKESANLTILPVEVVSTVSDSVYPCWGQGNVLPPHASVEVNATCPWDTLTRLKPQTIEFRWIFDNSEAAQQDSNILPVRYTSNIFAFKKLLNPANRLDSVYYQNMLADLRFGSHDYQTALNLCNQTLRLDSLNFKALELATDICWKMGNYKEALVYVKKGIDLLQRQLPGITNSIAREEVSYYLSTMEQRKEKISQHETWCPVGYPRQ